MVDAGITFWKFTTENYTHKCKTCREKAKMWNQSISWAQSSECIVNAFWGVGGPPSSDGQGKVVPSVTSSMGRLSEEGATQQSLEGRQFTVPTMAAFQKKPFPPAFGKSWASSGRSWVVGQSRVYKHSTVLKAFMICPKPTLQVWCHAHTRCSIRNMSLITHQPQPTYFCLLFFF